MECASSDLERAHSYLESAYSKQERRHSESKRGDSKSECADSKSEREDSKQECADSKSERGRSDLECARSDAKCLRFWSEYSNKGFIFIIFLQVEKKVVDRYLLYIAKYAYKFRSRCAIGDAGIFADIDFGILLLVLCVKDLTLKFSPNSRVI